MAVLPLSLFAACGDDGSAKPDAGPRVDAPKQPDGPLVDAPEGDIDAPIDSPPSSGGTRIWVTGDVVTNNTNLALAFDEMTTLPVDAAMATKVPSMGELFDGTGTTANVFDANGGKIAFVADNTVVGRFDLNIANLDGSSPSVLVQGAMNIEFPAVSISPDGTKVAFTMDSAAIDGGYDLYMVATTNPQAPAKLSPDRPLLALDKQNLDVFNLITWSRDSKYVGFSGDLEENSFFQAYVVDTTVATPAAVALLNRNEIGTQAMGGQGINGAVQFDSANNVYFRARIDANSTQWQAFKATTAGAASRTVLTMPARGDASVPDVNTVTISPDGNTIVFSADAPTATRYDFYKSAVGTFAPTAITALAATGRSNTTAPVWFSPDGTKLAVTADYLSMGARNEPYVIALDGSTMAPRRLVAIDAACVNCDVNIIQWAPDNTTAYLMGDIAVANDTEIFKVNATMTDQAPTLAVDFVMGGDATNLFVRAE